MDHYIAVTDIHDRPDLSEPVRITKTGQPIALTKAQARELGAAVRAPTDEEAKQFNLDAEDEPKKAPAKAAAAPTKAPAAPKKAAAAKPAAEAATGAEGNDTAAGAGGEDTTAGDDTSGMV